MSIKPALTPEEWAAGKVVFKTRARYDEYGLELPAARDRSASWYDGKGAALIVFDGSWAAPIKDVHRMAAAAFCLHGRITWEMVDALRRAIEAEYEGRRGPDLEHVAQLEALADLLESLLPPR